MDKDENWTVYDKTTGLLLDLIDAIELDGKGGVWLGFFVEAKGEGTDMVCNGAYQHIDSDGKVTTYTNFENKSYGGNWVRSISMDDKGGVWVTRSGNYTGQGHGEVDYILDDVRTVYTAEQIYPEISTDDDIRFVHVSKDGKLYVATKLSGVLVCNKPGEIVEKYNSTTVFPNKKWDNIYYLKEVYGEIVVGSNGGLAVLKEAKILEDIKSNCVKESINKVATMVVMLFRLF